MAPERRKRDPVVVLGELPGATGVNVGGAVYDVFLDSGAGNFDTSPGLTFGCSGIFCGTVTPFGQPDTSNMPAVSAVNFVTEASDVAGNGMTARTYDVDASDLHELSVFAIWTPAEAPVPALPPIAQGLLIVAMAGATAVARKRQ